MANKAKIVPGKRNEYFDSKVLNWTTLRSGRRMEKYMSLQLMHRFRQLSGPCKSIHDIKIVPMELSSNENDFPPKVQTPLL